MSQCFKAYRAKIEGRLEELVPEKPGPCNQLYKAVRYALLGGGKRMRPLLTLVATECLGGDVDKALDPACALEMVHAYSLIHDDLPCMDNDTIRRGKPTVHCAFPEGHAVLAGDFLLTYAFEVLSLSPHLTDQQKVALSRTLAQGAGGWGGMIAGQVMDLEAEGLIISLQELEMIHHAKTGALFSTALEFGALVAEVDPAPLKIFGESLGLAFQVVDDILDVTAPEKQHGTQSDAANQKATYVSHLGLEKAQETADKLLIRANQALAPLPYNTKPLAEMAHQLINRIY